MTARATVHKFGGTSLADADRMRHVADLVAHRPEPAVVVVSAAAGVTDVLAALTERPDPAAVRSLHDRHAALARSVAPGDAALGRRIAARLAALSRTLDAVRSPERDDSVLAAGEDLSALLLAATLRSAGRAACVANARRFVRTDARHGRAVPDGRRIAALAPAVLGAILAAGAVPVVQGFVGATARGATTTLGRGGSDYTAALLGAALSTGPVHLWSDVPGVLSGDPSLVDDTRTLPEIGFAEAVELSWTGARVLHPVAAKWAVAHGVPLRLRSTFHPDHPGTLVRADVREVSQVAAITVKRGVALVEVRARPRALPYGFLARVFGVLGRHRLEVDLVATSHSSTAFTLDAGEEIADVVDELAAFADVTASTGLATVTAVGRGLLGEPGMAARAFWALERTPVHLISQASDVSLSLVVDAGAADAVVRRLHRALVERPAAGRRSA